MASTITMSHSISNCNKSCCTFFALCSVLIMLLIIDSQPQVASASAISSSVEQQQQQQQQQKYRKSTGGWVQTYKEPNSIGADGHGGRAVRAGPGEEPAADPEEQEQLTCTIKVQKVEKHSGKCVRLRGGVAACQSGTYLDPVNEDCMFLA